MPYFKAKRVRKLQRRTLPWECFVVSKNKCINRQDNQAAAAAAAKFHETSQLEMPSLNEIQMQQHVVR